MSMGSGMAHKPPHADIAHASIPLTHACTFLLNAFLTSCCFICNLRFSRACSESWATLEPEAALMRPRPEPGTLAVLAPDVWFATSLLVSMLRFTWPPESEAPRTPTTSREAPKSRITGSTTTHVGELGTANL